jgi:hypothetical protein
MEKLKNNKEVEEKKKEAIIEASKSARERHGGNIRTAGMSLSLIQRMDTLKVPEKFFELDYLAANFPSFKLKAALKKAKETPMDRYSRNFIFKFSMIY